MPSFRDKRFMSGRRRAILLWIIWIAATLVLIGVAAFLAQMTLRQPAIVRFTSVEGGATFHPHDTIKIEFNQLLRADSVAGALRLDPPTRFTLQTQGATVLISPTDGLHENGTYRLTIDQTLRNLLGRTPDSPQSFTFTILSYVMVANVGPAKDAADVALQTPITVEFDRPVVPAASVAAAARDPRLADRLPQPLALVGGDAQKPMSGVGRWLSPTQFSFAPEGGLRAGLTYAVTVRGNISADGRALMEQPFVWRFKTATPLLVSSRPSDRAIEVPTEGPVDVRLAPDTDPASAARHFGLYNASGLQVRGSIQQNEHGFIFKPARPLDRHATYEARITAGVKSKDGVPLNIAPLIWHFTVIGDLEIADISPPFRTQDVAPDIGRISVRFNHPIVAVTTAEAQSSLPQPLTIEPQVQGSGRWTDSRTYTFFPSAPLTPATTYIVNVVAGIEDQTGSLLPQDFTWSFITVVPIAQRDISSSDPLYPNNSLKVDFNLPMDPDSLRRAIRLVRADTGEFVPGDIAVAPRQAIFTPTVALERGADYLFIVTRDARTAPDGVALAKEYVEKHRELPLPDFDYSRPADGETSVTPESVAWRGSGIRLGFTAPMDWASVAHNLTIEPAPTALFTNTGITDFSLDPPLQPDTDYRVTIGAAAQDKYGVPIGHDVVIRFHTGSEVPPSAGIVTDLQPPYLAFANPGNGGISTYNANAPLRIALRYINTPTITYNLYQLDPSLLPDLLAGQGKLLDRVAERATLARQDQAQLNGPPNQLWLDVLDLGQVSPGLYFLSIGDARVSDYEFISISPYALTLKQSTDELFLWAVDLLTGQPIADLSLTGGYTTGNASGLKPIQVSSTDADGVARIPLSADLSIDQIYLWSASLDHYIFIVSSRSGGSLAYGEGSQNWGRGIQPNDFGLSGEYLSSPAVGMVETDRPLYRPEDTVQIRGTLRLDDDRIYRLPSPGQSVALQIRDPNGITVVSTTLALNATGSFSTSLPLGHDARLGTYAMFGWLEDAPAANDVAYWPNPYGARIPAYSLFGTFVVSEYRKPTFEVSVTPEKGDLVQGETLVMNISAHYFNGPPVANAPIYWRLFSEPLSFSSDQVPSFRFTATNDAAAFYRNSTKAPPVEGRTQLFENQAMLDGQGHFRLETESRFLDLDNQSRRFTLVVEVTDVDTGVVNEAEANADVHFGDFYIGLRPERYLTSAGQPQHISAQVFDPSGHPTPNRVLQISISRRDWFSVREQGSDGRFYWTSTFSDTLVERQSISTDSQGAGAITFTPSTGGLYRIDAVGTDEHSNVIKTSAYTWVYGGDLFWGIDDTNRIDLIADRDNYNPGDVADILIPAPYKGMTALLTIERGKVIEHRLFVMQGTTEVLHLPIKEDYAPNIYVSVTLIKPAAPQSGYDISEDMDSISVPELRVGMINLLVSTQQRKLNIAVTTDKHDIHPHDQVTFMIKVTDHQGNGIHTELSMALVDKALLTLIKDPNPSIVAGFYRERPLGVLTASSLVPLLDRVTVRVQPGSKGGAGGGGLTSDVLLRLNFPDTAYWNASLMTDDDGNAQVTITLPDSATTWRMRVRGMTGDARFGEAASEVVVSRPLLVRPILPAFLTAGDHVLLQAMIQNNTATAIDASVDLEASGLTLKTQQQQPVQVPAHEQRVVSWQAETSTADHATLTFTADGGKLTDKIEQRLPIQQYVTTAATASAGQVLDSIAERIEPPSLPAGQTSKNGGLKGELNLELTPSIADAINSALQYLDNVPNEGAEQTISGFLPHVVAYRLLKLADKDHPGRRVALDQNLTVRLQRLYSQQNTDGGWGWWASRQISHPYLTAYVVHGLFEARAAGFAVDQTVLDNGVAYLQAALDSSSRLLEPSTDEPWRLDARSYALFVLAEAGIPDRGRTMTLFDQRAGLGTAGKAYLLMTMRRLEQPTQAQILNNELMRLATPRPTDAYWSESTRGLTAFSSNVQATAVVLQALARSDPENFLVPNAIRYLMSQRDADHWSNTLESAVVIQALAEYVAANPAREPHYTYNVTLDGRVVSEGTVDHTNFTSPISLTVPIEGNNLGSPTQLTIQRQDQEQANTQPQLYYNVRMRYYQDASIVHSLDQGLIVGRSYIGIDPRSLLPTGQAITEAKLGDVVQVHLSLNVPNDMEQLVVEDMLPAGLEPLAITPRSSTVSGPASKPVPLPTTAVDPSVPEEQTYFDQISLYNNHVALFANYLPKGTYQFTYLARATTIGTFQTLPTTAREMYAPEVFGRSDGTQFTVAEQ